MTFRTCADVSLSPRARKSPRRKKKNFKHLVLLFLFNGRSFFPLGSLTVVVVVLILFFFLFIEAHTLRSRSIFRCALAHQFNDLGVVPSSYGFLLATEFFRCVIYRLPLHLKVKKDSRKLFRRKQIPGRDDTILCVCVCVSAAGQRFNWMHDRPPLESFHFSSSPPAFQHNEKTSKYNNNNKGNTECYTRISTHTHEGYS